MFRVKEENTEGKMKINESTPFSNHYFHGNINDSDHMLKALSFGSFSRGFDSPLFDTLLHETTLNPTFRYMDDSGGLMMKNHNKECMLDIPLPYDVLGLSQILQRIHIGNSAGDQLRVDPDGVLLGFNDPLSDAFYGTYPMGLGQGFDVNDSMGKYYKSVVDMKSSRFSKVNQKKKKQRNDFLKERSNEKERVQGTCHDAMPLYCSLADLKGYIYLIVKDQIGCRFLQSVVDEGNNEDVKIIFSEIIHHVVELMMDPFANYLIQKLIDYCSEEQKLKIVLMVTKRDCELVNICMNTHGTRVVQKLIENMKSKQQISLLMISLKPGMVELIKDMNGNHVVQRCLQCLTNEQNKFIFDAAAKFCVEIACHRHGCCVLNRCVAYSSGMHREKLVTSISANGIFLAQDAFGNYVIQHILELKIPYAAATLLSVFEGHYVYMSMQKFSSHVVEKCLRCVEESRSRIIHELISFPYFDQLLQDRFANYVIQAALEVTKGSLHSVLVEAVRPYQILRTSPYCKKIFSRQLLKK